MTIHPGTLVAGRFRVDALLGSGGAGTVYRATQEPLHRPVALKVLRDDLSGDETVRRRFVREARAVAALSHPHIAMVHDFGQTDSGTLYMAMEFVEGASLDHVLAREAPSWPLLRTLFDQLLSGLAHAHARGVVHRDIKPGNVLIAAGPDGTPNLKIVDFGIAELHGFEGFDDADTTGSGRVVGTPHFMAPEQARGEKHVTATVDVYTVGLLLYWAISGRHAFDGDTPMDIMMAQVSHAPPAMIERPGLIVPPGIEDLVLAALAKEPRERIPSATAFRSRLRALAGGFADDVDASIEVEPVTAPSLAPAQQATMLEPGTHTLREEELAQTPATPAPAPTLRPSLRTGSATVVGRDDERRRLLEVVHDSWARERGLILTLEGEAGLGKSTLATWIRDQVLDVFELTTGRGTCHREGERGLRGVREALEGALDVRGLPAEQLARELAGRLISIGVTDARDAGRLMGLLRPELRDSDAPERASALYEVVLRTLTGLGAERPVLLVVDDIQWAGEETFALLEYLATEFSQRPARVVVVVTVQLDEDDESMTSSLRQLSRYNGTTALRHRLTPFDDDAARDLIASLIDASPALRDAVVRRAGGNPMHLVQLVRYLSDEGLIEPSPRGWRARRGVRVDAVLPPDLADLVQLRIAQVEADPDHGERLHALLDRAAVLGRSFRFQVLERMLRSENRADLIEHIDADVDRLLDEDLLRMRETRDDDILSFPTSLIRDVVARRLENRRTTRRLHRYAAEAKLAILGESVDRIAPELVAHFAAARDRRRELEYSRIAAEAANRTHRPSDALRYYDRAIELVREVDADESGDTASSRSMLLKSAGIAVGLGRYAVADQRYRAIVDDPKAPDADRIAALYGVADVAWISGRFDDALATLEKGVALAEAMRDPARIARGLGELARVEWHRGNNDRSAELVERALKQAHRAANPAGIAEALWLKGDIARGRGDVDAAEALFEDALQRFTALDRPRGVAKCHAKLAVTARLRDDLDAAVDHYEKALGIYRDHGGQRGVAHQLNGLGDVARYRGDLSLAADNYRRAVDIFQSLRLPYDTAMALTNLGLAAREAGNLDEAIDALRRALTVSERVGYAYLTLGIRLNLAHALALVGFEDESEAMLSASLELADSVELVDPDYALPLELLGNLKAASGKTAEADALYVRAREMWHEMGRLEDEARVDRRLQGDDDA